MKNGLKAHGGDVGYFQVKHSRADGRRFSYPSLAGPTPASLGLADMGQTKLPYRMLKPHDMLIGRYAYAQGVGAPDLDIAWFRGDAYMAMLLAGLADCERYDISYKLCTGLPIDHLEYREELQARLSGTRQVVFDHIGKEQTIHIDAVVVAQGIGALATLLLDQDGNPTVPVAQLRDDEHAVRLAVWDCGAFTSCAVATRGLHVRANQTRSFSIGAWTVEQRCRNRLISSHGEGLVRGYGRHELMHLLRTNALTDRGQVIDTRQMFEDVCREVAGDLVTELHRLWGEARTFQRLIMCGGGSLLLGQYIKEAIPHIEPIPDLDPVYANSEGYRRIAELSLK